MTKITFQPTNEEVESAAEIIYESMRFDRVGATPAWQERGNSFAQDEARRCASAVLVGFVSSRCQVMEPDR